MKRPTIPLRTRCRNTGFTLVEVMVGMLLGMFGIIIMMQVFALSEERKRATTSGGDATSEGVMAVYALQRDIRQAGYGFAATAMFGCTISINGVSFALGPVTINPATTVVPAGDANSDTLLIVYGNPDGQPEGQTGTPTLAASTYYVQSSPCNPSPITLTAAAGTVAAAGTLYDLGANPRIVAYAVRNSTLTACDYVANNCSLAANLTNPAIWVPVANNVVSLRAEYGQDTTATPTAYTASTWNQTTPSTTNGSAFGVPCQWTRIPAVRFALVSRNVQYEKNTVTAAAPVWDGSTGTPIVLSGNTDWQNYRYKLFETVVPLRNIAWMGLQTGC